MSMAKRLTDTGKWDDPWFLELPAKYKFMWLFILDKCDHAGIYRYSKRMIEFSIEQEIDIEEIKVLFKDRIIMLNSEKWFIPKFIKFQYGALNPKSQIHASVIRILQDVGAIDLVSEYILNTSKKSSPESQSEPLPNPCPTLAQGLPNPCQRIKDKEQVKDKDKDQKQEKIPPIRGLIDKELQHFLEGCKKTGETLTELDFTDEFRFALRNILDSVHGGTEKWLKACDNLARAPDDVRYVKSVLWLLEKKQIALNRVVQIAAMSNGNGSSSQRKSRYQPPEDWSLTENASKPAAK